MDNTFATFAIGDDQYLHRQANFAAVSILAHSETPPTILVATDRPEHYRWLEGRVKVLRLDEPTLQAWRAPFGYFWRIKLRLMQQAYEESPGNLVYFDSDVACRAPLGRLCESLDGGRAFMHKVEYVLCAKGGRGRALWKQCGSARFGSLEVNRTSRMWNAGVVALPARLAETRLAAALECLDAMCEAGIDSTLLEQLSLSLSLDADGRLGSAEEWFIHYWGNKTAWNALIARFLADVCVERMPAAEACARYRELGLHLPPMIKRKRAERWVRSLQKRLAPRDHSVVAQLTAQLLD